MNKQKIIVIGLIGFVVVGFLLSNSFRQEGTLSNPLASQLEKVKNGQPSESFKEYTDPSGFAISYPDNLSISKNEVGEDTYADIQLSSKDVNGSLSLSISDSKFTTLDEWLTSNKATPENTKEVKLGSLSAKEIKLSDRLLIGALDQGIFFSIEVPRVEENFWMKVYEKVLASFSFSAPESTAPQGNTDTSAGDVYFEGEEVVE